MTVQLFLPSPVRAHTDLFFPNVSRSSFPPSVRPSFISILLLHPEKLFQRWRLLSSSMCLFLPPPSVYCVVNAAIQIAEGGSRERERDPKMARFFKWTKKVLPCIVACSTLNYYYKVYTLPSFCLVFCNDLATLRLLHFGNMTTRRVKIAVWVGKSPPPPPLLTKYA